MAAKSVRLLEVVLVLILLVYQDVAYATDLNKASGASGLVNGGKYGNPVRIGGYGPPLYVIIYRNGYPPQYVPVYPSIYGGGLGPGYSGGFSQPLNGGVPGGQTGFFGGLGN